MDSTTASSWSYADQEHWSDWDNKDETYHGWGSKSNECAGGLGASPAYPGQSPIAIDADVMEELASTPAAYFNLSDSFSRKRSGLMLENTGSGLRVVVCGQVSSRPRRSILSSKRKQTRGGLNPARLLLPSFRIEPDVGLKPGHPEFAIVSTSRLDLSVRTRIFEGHSPLTTVPVVSPRRTGRIAPPPRASVTGRGSCVGSRGTTTGTLRTATTTTTAVGPPALRATTTRTTPGTTTRPLVSTSITCEWREDEWGGGGVGGGGWGGGVKGGAPTHQENAGLAVLAPLVAESVPGAEIG